MYIHIYTRMCVYIYTCMDTVSGVMLVMGNLTAARRMRPHCDVMAISVLMLLQVPIFCLAGAVAACPDGSSPLVSAGGRLFPGTQWVPICR